MIAYAGEIRPQIIRLFCKLAVSYFFHKKTPSYWKILHSSIFCITNITWKPGVGGYLSLKKILHKAKMFWPIPFYCTYLCWVGSGNWVRKLTYKWVEYYFTCWSQYVYKRTCNLLYLHEQWYCTVERLLIIHKWFGQKSILILDFDA